MGRVWLQLLPLYFGELSPTAGGAEGLRELGGAQETCCGLTWPPAASTLKAESSLVSPQCPL